MQWQPLVRKHFKNCDAAQLSWRYIGIKMRDGENRLKAEAVMVH
jgi:hypothetical protein